MRLSVTLSCAILEKKQHFPASTKVCHSIKMSAVAVFMCLLPAYCWPKAVWCRWTGTGNVHRNQSALNAEASRFQRNLHRDNFIGLQCQVHQRQGNSLMDQPPTASVQGAPRKCLWCVNYRTVLTKADSPTEGLSKSKRKEAASGEGRTLQFSRDHTEWSKVDNYPASGMSHTWMPPPPPLPHRHTRTPTHLPHVDITATDITQGFRTAAGGHG